ncbi:hypothetical protein BU16DRAFT_397898 [Lophium mytilinum]|uniref:Secreted protein n=1 Tax=Lophium mytilinum TaxID=390894 RepID=A0A6A6QTK1_9PEZI|nr:hypothetical protein BU16DRAFT_397898 [Lophium mytilinum]
MGWLLVLLLRVSLAHLVRAWERPGGWAMHKASRNTLLSFRCWLARAICTLPAHRASGPNYHAVCAAIAGAAS